jgi:ribosomal protein S12 methylthiotransferase accessory factor
MPGRGAKIRAGGAQGERSELDFVFPSGIWEAHVRAVIESAGGVASRVRLGAHEWVFDQPDAVPGGEDRGPSPLDVMIVSVGACAHYFAAAFLYARKLSCDGLLVEVEADKVRDPASRIGKLAIRLTVPASVPDHYLPGIERAVRQCPALGTLLNPPEVAFTVSRRADGVSPAA